LTSTSAIACNGSTAQANRGFGPQTKAAGTADNVPVIDMTVLTASALHQPWPLPERRRLHIDHEQAGLVLLQRSHAFRGSRRSSDRPRPPPQALKDQNIPLAAYLLN
jgi:hypothetical protein